MGFSIGGGSKQQTHNTSNSAAANVSGDTTAPVTSLVGSSGNTFNYTDNGSLALAGNIASNSFAFGNSALEKSLEIAKNGLEQSANAFETSREGLANGYAQSLAFVGKSAQPADEKTRSQFTHLALAALGLLAVVFIWGRK